MEDKLKQKQKSKTRKKSFQHAKHALIKVLIVYPFGYPYVKIEEAIKKERRNYWRKNIKKLQDKCMKEILHEIEKDMMEDNDVYYVYNARCHEDIRFSHAFYLQDFVGHSWRYRNKVHKWSMMYYEIKKDLLGEHYRQSDFYEDVKADLIKQIRTNYEDIELIENNPEVNHGFRRDYDYFTIQIKQH